MLEILQHDGAGRLGTLTLAERKLALPNLFWLPHDSAPQGGSWEPLLDRSVRPGATLVNTFSLVAPVPSPTQGSLLLQRRLVPTTSMRQGQPHLQLLGDAVAVFSGALNVFRNPKRFAPAIVSARTDATYARALYTPGLGEPAHLALLAYAGIDLFDAVPLAYAAARGQFLTESGSFEAAALAEPMCNCPVCAEAAPADQDEAALAQHNAYAARAELGAVRNALRQGRLRELVEGRVRSDPELTALLRRLDAQYTHFEERAPVHRSTPLLANTKESLHRVECERFRRRLQTRWAPPPEPPLLLLLPCSHRKPYSRSRTHRAIQEAIRAAGAEALVHEVIVTSPLGLVPRELEQCYPAAHYDVPVTGEWDEEEGALIRSLLQTLFSKRTYAGVIAHLPRHTLDLIQSTLPADFRATVTGEDATAPGALRELERALREEAARRPRPPFPQILRSRLEALASYQFGREPAKHLLKGAVIRGRWPMSRIVLDGTQLAMVPPERGLLSLTLDGARRLLETRTYAVEIDDFPIKGSVFSVGVNEADPQIRPGDEVVIHHKGDLRGVGVAALSGPEMIQLKRGEAVKVRHHA